MYNWYVGDGVYRTELFDIYNSVEAVLAALDHPGLLCSALSCTEKDHVYSMYRAVHGKPCREEEEEDEKDSQRPFMSPSLLPPLRHLSPIYRIPLPPPTGGRDVMEDTSGRRPSRSDPSHISRLHRAERLQCYAEGRDQLSPASCVDLSEREGWQSRRSGRGRRGDREEEVEMQDGRDFTSSVRYPAPTYPTHTAAPLRSPSSVSGQVGTVYSDAVNFQANPLRLPRVQRDEERRHDVDEKKEARWKERQWSGWEQRERESRWHDRYSNDGGAQEVDEDYRRWRFNSWQRRDPGEMGGLH